MKEPDQPKADLDAAAQGLDPLDMEDSSRHSLVDNRFMGIRHHHVMRAPEDLISFRKLLFRWSHNSFYIVSYCAGLLNPDKDESGNYNFAMRLRVAKRIAAKTTVLEVDGMDKDAIKNRREMIVTLADCKQDNSLKIFPLFCNMFNLLYFDIAGVAAMERRFPEILLTDPMIQNADPLYTTTGETIDRVAPLALYYWHCITGSFGNSVDYIDNSGEDTVAAFPQRDELRRKPSWKLNGGIHFPGWQWKKFMRLPAENLSPTLPHELPEKYKRSRSNDIQEYRPLISQLESLGIDDIKNRARIIYSLFPQLNHSEIGRLFPASPDTKTSKQTDRDRGRWLLGLH